MMLDRMGHFSILLLLFLTAKSGAEVSATNNSSEKAKVESANITALYIGDLLRTHLKEPLKASGSIHRPIVLRHQGELLSSASVPDQTVEDDYAISHQSRSSRRGGGGAPTDVMGHILTLKPVRVVAADDYQNFRDSEPQPRHHPHDDCNKSSKRTYSSEERQHASEQPSYQRTQQYQQEYRNPPPPSSYSDEDDSSSIQTQSDPSTGTYDSKTYPSNTKTKSQSSGSYTKSKSTSVSRTVNPTKNSKRKVHVIPTATPYAQDYVKNLEPAHDGGGIIVYKVKEPQDQESGSYSQNTGREYTPQNHEKSQKLTAHETEYSHDPPQRKKSRKQSDGRYTHHYSTSNQNARPQSSHQQQDHYDHGSYPAQDQRYREQSKPTSNHRDAGYARQIETEEPVQKSHFQNYQLNPYETEHMIKPKSPKRQQNNERSNEGTQPGGTYSGPDYNYPQNHQIQSSRNKKEKLQSGYDNYPPREVTAEHSRQSYDRVEPSLRPSKKQMEHYAYKATPPHQETIEQRSTVKQPQRGSSRSPRSPLKSVIVEGRSQLPFSGNEPVIMVSKESKPQVSRSVSYSESSYNNMDKQGKVQSRSASASRPRGQTRRNEARPFADTGYQTAYKPYNSEYPASYANDQHHNGGPPTRIRSQTRKRQYDESDSYESGPVNSQTHSQTQSHSGGGSQQYQEDEQPYDQDGYGDGSYEKQEGANNKGNHHYISKIEGYRDTYGKDEPLNIDEDFFKKYGISPNAKVIVATAEKPNLMVADGTKVKEGELFQNSEPSSEPVSELGASEEGSYEPGGYRKDYGPGGYEKDYEPAGYKKDYEPGGYRKDYEQDSYAGSQGEFDLPKQLPGSFDDLVDTNPKFLSMMNADESFFKMDSTETSFDDMEFPKERKGYVVSQGPREIVQQHGDGVSRIVFNMPRSESRSDTSDKDRLVEAASEIVENILKSDS